MALTFNTLIEQIQDSTEYVSVEELKRRMDDEEPVKVIDVRETDEYGNGRIPGAISAPRSAIEAQIERGASREDELVLYCASGTRSALAARGLKELGFANVKVLQGGYNRWTDSDYPTDKPFVLNAEQRERYRRHIVIPEVGEEGQKKLLQAKVIMLGAGGLGSPAAMYLAAAGVGTIGIMDGDVVDPNNLQRQVIHRIDRTGVPKVESARETIQGINPDVDVKMFQERVTSENVLDFLSGFDILMDGGDNFPTRYLLNDACVMLKMPLVSGAIYRFEGQVTTLIPGEGPCYRCLFPEPPESDVAPSCAEAGVLGVLPGTVGLLQATEVIKLILGEGRPLNSRILTYDALEASFRELKVRRNPKCKVCAPGAKIELHDYADVCAAPLAAS